MGCEEILPGTGRWQRVAADGGGHGRECGASGLLHHRFAVVPLLCREDFR